VLDGDAQFAEALSLIEQGFFDEAWTVLSRLGTLSEHVSLQALAGATRALCRAGAAHQRAAEQLEEAASQERASELQIQRRLLILLSGPTPSVSGGSPQGRSRRRRIWGRRRPIRTAALETDVESSSSLPDRPPPAGPPSEGPAAVHRTPGPEPRPPDREAAGAPPTADVVARVLGPLELVVLGREIREWGSFKGRSVLQYLLLSPNVPVRRETLMELLWPDHPHGSARNNLNVALYALRRAAFSSRPGGGPFIEHHQGAYMLGRGASWWIDRDGFLDAWNAAASAHARDDLAAARSAYEQAAALYRGRLFEDDPSGEWFLAEQRLLEERFLSVLERLASLQMASGGVESAVATLHRALARDACRESAHRLLMQCFAELHQHQMVTRQFHLCVDALDQELSVQPHPETVRLFHGLTENSG
jgi:DNA-binding SARP family transcriptional activator